MAFTNLTVSGSNALAAAGSNTTAILAAGKVGQLTDAQLQITGTGIANGCAVVYKIMDAGASTILIEGFWTNNTGGAIGVSQVITFDGHGMNVRFTNGLAAVLTTTAAGSVTAVFNVAGHYL